MLDQHRFGVREREREREREKEQTCDAADATGE
jgi:hypothetical protein